MRESRAGTSAVVNAAMLSASVARKCFDLADAEHVMLASRATLEELLEVFAALSSTSTFRSSAEPIFRVPIVRRIEMVETTSHLKLARDPDDDRILELARDGRADCIITGDNDLLTLNGTMNLAIVTPAAFLAKYVSE